LGGRGGRRGSAIAPLERAMVVSYRLSIVTVALCVTIRPEFAIECLRRSNQQGVGHQINVENGNNSLNVLSLAIANFHVINSTLLCHDLLT